MTAVLGLMNKRGVAIAADSAVTRSRYRNGHEMVKFTKNGNKMLRLSDKQPISIMITGSADFLHTPWEVIIRHYRKKKNDFDPSTVEDCVADFFDYISGNDAFWNENIVKNHIKWALQELLEMAISSLPWDVIRKNKKDRCLMKPKTFLKQLTRKLSSFRKEYDKERCLQANKETESHFHEYVGVLINEYLTGGIKKDSSSMPAAILEQVLLISNELEKTLFAFLCSNIKECSATLIFSGYGKDEQYPSLIASVVCEGFDHIVNYHNNKIVHISDSNPVAICPFAQDDIVSSTLEGVHYELLDYFIEKYRHFYSSAGEEIFGQGKDNASFNNDFYNELEKLIPYELDRQFRISIRRKFLQNHRQWEKALVHYDLQSMASLAGNLIELTGFHRILTFKHEGVGGPVDLAVISRAEGFTWLSRKSWYHHKDVNGQYGKFGV